MVNPRVRLVRPRGRGAMGSPWIAEHLTLGTEIAVKFINTASTRAPISIWPPSSS
jgi:serine/threonine-protein kinase